jgi:two-component system nitrogen regulation sensor histidine kinase NtrY
MRLQTRLGAYLAACTCCCSAARSCCCRRSRCCSSAPKLLLAASLALGWWLVRRALEPLGYTRRFHDLLQDQQYANRLAAPGVHGTG